MSRLFFFSSEKDFNVQTCTIALDFNSGKDVYSVVWEKIKDKEVGILGKSHRNVEWNFI